MKRIVTVFGALGLATVMGITMIGGVVDAQTATPSDTGASTSKKDQFLSTLAGKLGVTTDALQTAFEQTADELGFGPGRLGERLRERIQHHRDQIMDRIDVAPAATFLGISEDQLTRELQDEHSFIEVARNHGKTDDQIRTFLIERATERIDQRLQGATGEASPATGA